MDGLRKVINEEYVKLKNLYHTSRIYDSDDTDDDNYSATMNLPYSVFAYYCATLAYARLLKLVNETMLSCSSQLSPLTDDEQKFLACLEDNSVQTEMLNSYLGGFGSIRTVSGHILKFKFLNPTYMASSNGVIGWFGRVSKDTHLFYKTYPCLAVFVQAMIQDLKYTAEIADSTWDLPADIRPTEPGAGLPTQNLLGYQRAVKLTRNQVQFLNCAGVTLSSSVCFDNKTLPLLLELIHNVDSCVSIYSDRHCNRKYPIEKLSSSGSLAQCVTTDHHSTSLSCDSHCYYNIDKNIGLLGSIFHYRIHHQWEENPKNTETVKATWSIYDFKNYTEVPKKWTEIINKQRKEEPSLLNSGLFILRHNLNMNYAFFSNFKEYLGKATISVCDSFNTNNKIFPGCDGFRAIVEIEYRRLYLTNDYFRMRVPFSAFAYYCAIFVYLRFDCFMNFRFISKSLRSMLSALKEGYKLSCHNLELLTTYLKGFGDTDIYDHESSIRCSFFNFKFVEGGWFGKVSKDTHFLYKSYPCLAVFTQAMIQDLKFTNGVDVENWDLPLEIRPAEENAGFPTTNMLGYQPAVKLSTDQVTFLNAYNIERNKSLILYELIYSIQRIIMRSHSDGPRDEFDCSTKGSQGQLVIIKPEYRVHHQWELNCEKEGTVKANWSIYDFKNFTEVPNSWAKTANTFRDKEPDFLKLSESDGLFEVDIKNPDNVFTNLHLKGSKWP
ncbi:uncharacterized protein LOC117174767 [Belonocnema kinseyi]|uniref:uncharacterized protein LOC117174767 n=1 Tax=Belonocnema kinseyi TaxID=2817044 RepID=UPI00143DB50C|nr:uncharacterized protein LOC117174767 [Belonocnema kinseyi]